jgi:hypothetical protein
LTRDVVVVLQPFSRVWLILQRMLAGLGRAIRAPFQRRRRPPGVTETRAAR